jgi:hypothetical protein
VSSSSRGVIACDDSDFDLQDVYLDTTVQHVFTLRNKGDEALQVTHVATSCGCTAAVVDTSQLLPGGLCHVRVTLNTTNKGAGQIVKTVTVSSNSKVDPSFVIRLHGRLIPRPNFHSNRSMNVQNLFKGDCARCHVTGGRGLSGVKLYREDCGICHGEPKDGKPGRTLPDLATSAMSAEKLYRVISEGIRGSNMPGFSNRRAGPLDSSQIKSLCAYLRLNTVTSNLQPR